MIHGARTAKLKVSQQVQRHALNQPRWQDLSMEGHVKHQMSGALYTRIGSGAEGGGEVGASFTGLAWQIIIDGK